MSAASTPADPRAQPGAPRLAITLGDPSGIGAEIVARALAAAPALAARAHIFGDAGLLARGARVAGVRLPALTLVEVTHLDLERDAPHGRPTPAGGAAQVAYLEAATRALAAGQPGSGPKERCDALITAPISKAAAQAAGFGFPGHTEFLAARAGDVPVAMMLAGPRLRVVLATIHIGLAEVPRLLTSAAITQAITLAAAALRRDFALARPRIAVAGLNPHAGEQGAFGDEEARVIAPTIVAARSDPAAAGAEVTGPHVPDAVFRAASEGRFDAVVCMYHDQGLIPIKLLDFEEAVNVTLGLPYPRTSPDHGVAYDIAGQGVARATSFQRALELADRLARGRAGG